MQLKSDANWPEATSSGKVQGKVYQSTIEKHLVSDAENTVAQTECGVAFFLTSTYALMYHREVSVFPQEYAGRLLKLVDRTDLGSVGASHESSSLSPPTHSAGIKVLCCV